MNQELSNAIEEYGGKHGPLIYFQNSDQHIEIADSIVPFIIFSINEEVTQAMFDELMGHCNKHQVDRAIVRPSERTDLEGLVDALETAPNVKLDLANMKSNALHYVRQCCRSKALKRFAEKEGSDYDPDRVSISVAPWLQQQNLTVTEHPNQEGLYYFDIGKHYAMAFPKITYHPSAEEYPYFKRVMEIIEATRGEFPDDVALQWEFGVSGKNDYPNLPPHLFQIRYLGPKKIADYELDGEGAMRCFGVIPEDGLELKIANNERKRTECLMNFEKNSPETDYVLSPIFTDRYLDFEDNPSRHMKGYLPLLGSAGSSHALAHNHTRFVQRALKNEGFAVLGEAPWIQSDLETASSARFFCDGRDSTVKDIE